MTGYDNIEYASLSDVGMRRSVNEDAFAELAATDADQWHSRGHLFLVADGLGAHAVGELASKLAADSIPHIYAKHAQEGPAAALRHAFLETNVIIHTRGQQNRDFQGMGTTATALLIRPEGAWIGHVGDSRAYRIREGRIEQLSFDHSFLWEVARRRRVDPQELERVHSNVIVRSLGPEPLVQVDVEGPHPLQSGDVYVLCSDGLSGPLGDREIGAAAGVLPPDEACRLLVDLANLQGGPDNVTVVVIRLGKVGTPSAPPSAPAARHSHDRLPWPLAALFLGILLALGAILLTNQELTTVGILMFLLATVALVSGMLGLLVQSSQEKPVLAPQSETTPARIHRHQACAVDAAYLQRISKALATLATRLKEQASDTACRHCREHQERAEQLQQAGETVAAFREYCRALHVVAEALLRQRPKGETFEPLWETADR